ncbi:hypothetical protein ELD86_20240 [Escherichia coli]|nr:hypothetical protein [Escherichia coli]EFN8398275.1 hypothetical protein [Escherichia coli O26]EEW2187319.1 hypothetical protein [Escherichia coli]EFN6981559.1 hypothetical protein [Escherichia coli]EFO0721370.1 hypothetical protein [Escherichia coli]
MLSDCHSPDRIRLPLRRMLNALCSRVLQVRFIYAGYTPAIRDSPVGTTQSAATAFSCPLIALTVFISHI